MTQYTPRPVPVLPKGLDPAETLNQTIAAFAAKEMSFNEATFAINQCFAKALTGGDKYKDFLSDWTPETAVGSLLMVGKTDKEKDILKTVLTGQDSETSLTEASAPPQAETTTIDTIVVETVAPSSPNQSVTEASAPPQAETTTTGVDNAVITTVVDLDKVASEFISCCVTKGLFSESYAKSAKGCYVDESVTAKKLHPKEIFVRAGGFDVYCEINGFELTEKVPSWWKAAMYTSVI